MNSIVKSVGSIIKMSNECDKCGWTRDGCACSEDVVAKEEAPSVNDVLNSKEVK